MVSFLLLEFSSWLWHLQDTWTFFFFVWLFYDWAKKKNCAKSMKKYVSLSKKYPQSVTKALWDYDGWIRDGWICSTCLYDWCCCSGTQYQNNKEKCTWAQHPVTISLSVKLHHHWAKLRELDETRSCSCKYPQEQQIINLYSPKQISNLVLSE